MALAKRITKDLDQRDLAVRRQGETWKDRLRWIVDDFARRDLRLARREELTALGYDLRALTPTSGTITPSRHAPVPAAEITRIHATVNAALRRLLASETIGLRGGWTLPTPKAVGVMRHGGIFLRVSESRSEADSILTAIAEHVIHAGDDLRACPECKRPFVRRGRRLFCGEACSMRVRNRHRPKVRKRGAR
jgi:hypothetical protein